MNVSAFRGVSMPAADANQAAAAPHSDGKADQLTAGEKAYLANPLHGWMAAHDAYAVQRDAGEWGVTFAESIKRALAAGDTKGAERLATIQQFVFDHVYSSAFDSMADPHGAMDYLQQIGAR